MGRRTRRRPTWRQALILAVILYPGLAGADEAVTWQGGRLSGTLRNKDFLLTNTGKTIPLERIHDVRFAWRTAYVPRGRLWHQLRLSGNQRLSGELLALGPKDVQFRAADGNTITLARGHIQGITAADGYLVQWLEDFEGNNGRASWGKSSLSGQHAFTGKRSLLVNSSFHDVEALLSVPQKAMSAYRVAIHFFDPGLKTGAGARVHFVFQAAETSVPISLFLAGDYYRPDNDAGHRLQASTGWHILQLDWNRGETRAFIDDFFIGSRATPVGARLASLRFSFEGKGGMWFDDLCIAEKAPRMARMPGPSEVDEVWLASGDQVFGELLKADVRAIAMQARFGRRIYPWSNVRGIFFRSEAKSLAIVHGVNVTFRSGPGVSADHLTGEIVDLDERRLLIRHGVLGQVEIPRARLERIRFPEAAVTPR
jgi:hypothetical protein